MTSSGQEGWRESKFFTALGQKSYFIWVPYCTHKKREKKKKKQKSIESFGSFGEACLEWSNSKVKWPEGCCPHVQWLVSCTAEMPVWTLAQPRRSAALCQCPRWCITGGLLHTDVMLIHHADATLSMSPVIHNCGSITHRCEAYALCWCHFVSVPANAQLGVCDTQMWAYSSCWFTHIFCDRNDRRWVGKQSNDRQLGRK